MAPEIDHDRARDSERRPNRQPMPAAENSAPVSPATARPFAAATPPSALRPADVLALQRTVGNQAVQRLLAGSTQSEPGASPNSALVLQRKKGTSHYHPYSRSGKITGTQADKLKRAAQEQADAMQWIVGLYVPETFDANGEPSPKPKLAHTTRQNPGDVDLLRSRRFQLPRTEGRNIRPQANYPARFESNYFHYDIQLVNASIGDNDNPRTGVNPDLPFTVIDRTIKGSGRAGGRVNRIAQERWAHNPAYWAARGGLAANQAQADQLASQHDLADTDQADAANPPQGFTALPTDASQPYIFYVETGRVDPNFRLIGNQRRFLSTAQFDQQWALAPPTGQKEHQAHLSVPPQVPRQDADRDTASAMGGAQATSFMGNQGEQGERGVRLASHEWCHLVGDGDSGQSVFANLVIGTNAVNTEQLALELALRDYRPQLAGLNCGVALKTKVLTENAPVPTLTSTDGTQVNTSGQNNLANWISYEISVVNSNNPNDAQRIPVHRQIMDGKRGTITRGEFNFLHSEARRKLRLVVAHLKAAHDADQYDLDNNRIVFEPAVFAYQPA